jgi:hypothetical protein
LHHDSYAFAAHRRGRRWRRCTVLADPWSMRVHAAVDPAGAEWSENEPTDVRSDGSFVVVPLLLTDPADPTPWEWGISATGAGREGPDRLWVRVITRSPELPVVYRWDVSSSAPGPIPAAFHGPAELAPASGTTRSPAAGERWTLQHLVGMPVRTRAGWRLRVREHVSASDTYASRSRLTGERLIGADDLPCASTALVVLQAEPSDDRPEPLGDLRAGMVDLAAEIIAGGARAVLVVPQLPDEPAASMVRETLNIFVDSAPRSSGPHRLLALAQRARVLASSGPQPPKPGGMPEHDVMLFLSTE